MINGSRRIRYTNAEGDHLPYSDVIAMVWWLPFLFAWIIGETFKRLPFEKLHTLVYPLQTIGVIGVVAGVITMFVYFNRSHVPTQLDGGIGKMTNSDVKTAKRILKQVANKSVLVDRLGVGVKTSNHTGYLIPFVRVEIDGDSGFVDIENLGANLKRLLSEDMLAMMSGLFAGKTAKFSAVRSHVLPGKNWVRFEIEDVRTSHRYLFKGDYAAFVSPDMHSLRLADDLVVNMRREAHVAIIGRSGTGKSQLLAFMAGLAEAQGWETVRFHSLKSDGLVQLYNGSSTSEGIIDDLENWVTVMRERQKAITDRFGTATGVDYADMDDMKDVMIIVDEMGWLNDAVSGTDKASKELKARLDSALGILAKGARSVGLHLVLSAQYGSNEALKVGYRQQLNARIIMGNSSALERQFLFQGYEVDDSEHLGLGEGLALFNYSGPKWTEPRKFQAPWIAEGE